MTEPHIRGYLRILICLFALYAAFHAVYLNSSGTIWTTPRLLTYSLLNHDDAEDSFSLSLSHFRLLPPSGHTGLESSGPERSMSNPKDLMVDGFSV